MQDLLTSKSSNTTRIHSVRAIHACHGYWSPKAELAHRRLGIANIAKIVVAASGLREVCQSPLSFSSLRPTFLEEAWCSSYSKSTIGRADMFCNDVVEQDARRTTAADSILPAQTKNETKSREMK